MKPFAKALLSAILLGAIGTIGPLTAIPASAQAVVASERIVVFVVENMTCELCPITVRTSMERVPGVASVTIDFAAKTATVVYDPAIATDDAIAAASGNVGYPARIQGS